MPSATISKLHSAIVFALLFHSQNAVSVQEDLQHPPHLIMHYSKVSKELIPLHFLHSQFRDKQQCDKKALHHIMEIVGLENRQSMDRQHSQILQSPLCES